MNLFSTPVPLAAISIIVLALLAAAAWLRRPFTLRGFLRGGRFRRAYLPAIKTPPDVAAAAFNVPASLLRRPGEVPVFREPDGKLLGFLPGYADATFITAGGVQVARKRSTWTTRATAQEVRAAFPHFRAVALFLLALLLPLAARAADYQASDLSQFHHPAIRWGSPVCAVGFVESTRQEQDGDLHTWLCSSPGKRTMPERRLGCVLGEIVPSRPLPRPSRGARVRMCGSWVESDIPHGWTELHPVSSWAVAP